MNDHNDKSGEDSEYHFSGDDEEVNYAVEQDSSQSAAPSGPETRSANVPRESGAKRMFVSLGVFIVLVYVVYKIVAPGSSSAPATQITAPAIAQNTTANAVPPPNNRAATTMPAPANSMTPVTQQPTNQPVMPVLAAATTVNTPMSANQQANNMPIQPQTSMPAVATIPTVIPVQSPASNVNQVANVAMSPNPQVPQQVTGQEANLNSEAGRAASQLHSQYTQVITELSAQNKSLQGQIEELHARVAGLETQLHQLTTELLHQQSNTANPSPGSMNNENAIAPQLRPEPKISFNVQAIIPGRAWLRSDNGETVTVAEGDVIKDLGRITKIDPYDGIVEVNTGKKVLSLSYGNSG